MNTNPTVLKLLIRSWNIIFIPFGLISLAFLIWATLIALDEIDLKRNGIEIYGTVIDKWEDDNWERNLIEYEFSYNDFVYEKSSSVSYKIYKKTNISDKIVVIVTPNNPEINKMFEQDMGNMAFPNYYLMTIIALAFSYAAFYMVGSALLKTQLYRIGTRTKGTVDDIIHSTTVEGHKKYNVTISFQDDNGKQHSKTFKHQSEILTNRIKKGQGVDLIYNPKRPHKCTIPAMDGIELH